MYKQFSANVEAVFSATVTLQDDSEHTAAELLEILNEQDLSPLVSNWRSKSLRLVYPNVTIVLPSDVLTWMEVTYFGEYTTIINDISHCELAQLAHFVLAVNHDILQWRPIWLPEDALKAEKVRVLERYKTSLSQLHRALFRHKGMMADWEKAAYHRQFINIKAKALILEEGNVSRKDWEKEWNNFYDECMRGKAERDRSIEERRNKIQKMNHLIQMKYVKLASLIKAIDKHPNFSVGVEKYFDNRKLDAIKYGHYFLNLGIDCAQISISCKYDKLDSNIGTYVDVIQRINGLMPDLMKSLKDGKKEQKYAVHNDYLWHQRSWASTHYLYVAEHDSWPEVVVKDPDIPCVQITERINEIINEALVI